MVKLRAGALLAGAGKAQPMCNVGANAIVIKSPGRIKTHKSIIIANAPYFADGPDNAPLGLLHVWRKFGQIATAAKGQTGKGPNGWSKAAEAVHAQMGPVGIHGTGVGKKGNQMRKIEAAIRRAESGGLVMRQGLPELFSF